MRGDAFSMRVFRPASPAEAVRLFAQNPDALPLAGGTDLMVGWNSGRLNGRAVLDLSRLEEWRRIEVTDETITAHLVDGRVISVPLAWSPTGLPIGAMFSGRKGDDALLFELALELEAARPWADRKPPVSAL